VRRGSGAGDSGGRALGPRGPRADRLWRWCAALAVTIVPVAGANPALVSELLAL
jgi:hypothetical protein